MTEPRRARGRPSSYTKEIADVICKGLSEGLSLRKVCEADDMPSEATVRAWVVEDREGFSAHYARARDIGLDCRADALVDDAKIAKDASLGRLAFDADRWYLSKLAPKRYGDKITHVGGDPATDNPIQTAITVGDLTEEQLRVLASIPVSR